MVLVPERMNLWSWARSIRRPWSNLDGASAHRSTRGAKGEDDPDDAGARCDNHEGRPRDRFQCVDQEGRRHAERRQIGDKHRGRRHRRCKRRSALQLREPQTEVTGRCDRRDRGRQADGKCEATTGSVTHGPSHEGGARSLATTAPYHKAPISGPVRIRVNAIRRERTSIASRAMARATMSGSPKSAMAFDAARPGAMPIAAWYLIASNSPSSSSSRMSLRRLPRAVGRPPTSRR